MKRRNGSLIYDRNDCRSEDLARVEIRLKQARIKYTLRCIDDVHCEQGIAFDFDKRILSGQYSLAGLTQIISYCNNFIKEVA